MQNTSNQYKEQRNQSLRNPSYINVSIGIIDPKAIDSSSIYDNGEMIYSDSSLIGNNTYKVNNRYGKIYKNGFLLDGSLNLVPENNYEYQGYESSYISNDDSSFDVSPKITATFDEFITLAGLTISFDTNTNNYPTNITINIYSNDELTGTQEIENTSSELVFENLIPNAGTTNKIEIIFTKTNYPKRNINITSLLFGVIKTFTNDDFTSVSYDRDIDLVNSKLPTESLNFTIIDKEKQYNPENTVGIWNYLEEEQQVDAEIGYELNDGTIEWIDLCHYYTSGEVDISSDVIPKITFKSVSLLNYLTDNYNQNVYYEDGINFYDLATNIMNSLNLSENEDTSKKWIFDEEQMSKFTLYKPMEIMPVRECLQLIASATLCLLYTNRKGQIVIERKNYDFIEHPKFRLSFDDIYTPPKINKYPLLRDVIVNYTKINVADDVTELFVEDVNALTETTFEFSYDTSTEQSLSYTGVTIIGEPIFYAETCFIRLTGSGTLTVSGKIIETNIATYIKRYNEIGDDCEVELALVNTLEHAKLYADYIYDYVKLRTEYEVSDRGYMELDPGDSIFAQNNYNNYNGVVLSKVNLSFNGALKGKTKYYQTVDYSQYIDNTTVISNDNTSYSTPMNIIYSDAILNTMYGRTFKNGIVLDGTSDLIQESKLFEQGYVSNSISDASGNFDTNPTITIDFARYIILANGFTLTFADEMNYANSITFTSYNNNVLISTVTINNDSSVLYYDDVYPSESSMNRMVITFNSTNVPYRDIKLNNIYFGRMKAVDKIL